MLLRIFHASSSLRNPFIKTYLLPHLMWSEKSFRESDLGKILEIVHMKNKLSFKISSTFYAFFDRPRLMKNFFLGKCVLKAGRENFWIKHLLRFILQNWKLDFPVLFWTHKTAHYKIEFELGNSSRLWTDKVIIKIKISGGFQVCNICPGLLPCQLIRYERARFCIQFHPSTIACWRREKWKAAKFLLI